ncbi:1515_t:CDS:2 [Ambispora leptoticha]|uniref:1515_t:CDS:1 n=1 Tax=Ambispora leptoticha TaxID=144679 RepID=A0A9N9CXY2_9GLOM|nr:1515_t:CDS:2 [Ambispora leptoticha]
MLLSKPQIGIYAVYIITTTFSVTTHWNKKLANLPKFLKFLFNFSGLFRTVLILLSVSTTELLEYNDFSSNRYIDSDSNNLFLSYSLVYFLLIESIRILNSVFKLSFVAFLIWRLEQIHDSRFDVRVGIFLFTAMAAGQLLQLFTCQRPQFIGQGIDNYYCWNFAEISEVQQMQPLPHWPFLILDLLFELFFTLRLTKFLINANTNTTLLPENMRKPKQRTVFTAVIVWNSLRLLTSVPLIILSAYEVPLRAKYVKDTTIFIGIFALLNATLTIVMTFDTETVRFFEGSPCHDNNDDDRYEELERRDLLINDVEILMASYPTSEINSSDEEIAKNT